MEEDKKKRKNKNKKKKNKQTKGIENNAVGSEESASSIQNHAAELRGTEAHTDDTSGVDEDPSRHVTDGAKIVRNLFSCIKSRPANDDDDSAHNVELAGGNVCLITKKESWDKKLADANKEGKIVIANFSASWCGPCRMIAPFYSELSEKYPSLMFLTVDVDELTEFSSSWDIKATPTFFFLKDSQQIDKLVGANKPELQKKITATADSQIVCETQAEAQLH